MVLSRGNTMAALVTHQWCMVTIRLNDTYNQMGIISDIRQWHYCKVTWMWCWQLYVHMWCVQLWDVLIYDPFRHLENNRALDERYWRVKWDDIMFGAPEKRKLERSGSRMSLRVSIMGCHTHMSSWHAYTRSVHSIAPLVYTITRSCLTNEPCDSNCIKLNILCFFRT